MYFTTRQKKKILEANCYNRKARELYPFCRFLTRLMTFYSYNISSCLIFSYQCYSRISFNLLQICYTRCSYCAWWTIKISFTFSIHSFDKSLKVYAQNFESKFLTGAKQRWFLKSYVWIIFVARSFEAKSMR